MMEGSIARKLRERQEQGIPKNIRPAELTQKALFDAFGEKTLEECIVHLKSGNRRHFQELSSSEINLLFNQMIVKFDKNLFIDIMNFLIEDENLFRKYILCLKDDLIVYSLGNLYTCQTAFCRLNQFVLQELSFLRDPNRLRFLKKMFGALKEDIKILFGPDITSRAQFILNSKD